ncbi:MAG: hypothetical protein K0R28_5964 [Paenibacillus sp.]|nr:hypothetical protein [Paenibacillus sp.]
MPASCCRVLKSTLTAPMGVNLIGIFGPNEAIMAEAGYFAVFVRPPIDQLVEALRPRYLLGNGRIDRLRGDLFDTEHCDVHERGAQIFLDKYERLKREQEKNEHRDEKSFPSPFLGRPAPPSASQHAACSPDPLASLTVPVYAAVRQKRRDPPPAGPAGKKRIPYRAAAQAFDFASKYRK